MIKPFTGIARQSITCFINNDLVDLHVCAKYDSITGSIMITEVWQDFDNIIDELSDKDLEKITEDFIEKEFNR